MTKCICPPNYTLSRCPACYERLRKLIDKVNAMPGRSGTFGTGAW